MVQESVYRALLSRFEAGEADLLPVLVDALHEGVAGLPGSFGQVLTRARKNHPSEPVPKSYALVVSGESITLIGTRQESRRVALEDGTFDFVLVEAPYVRTYRPGDVAEYDSWNMSYYGAIESIGPKTVTIRAETGRTATARLSLETFSWRNCRFDREKSDARNLDVAIHT